MLDNVQGIRLDVTKPDDIEQVVQKITAEAGHLDCLVNNAGLMGWGLSSTARVDGSFPIFC